jgi:choline-sulfatase
MWGKSTMYEDAMGVPMLLAGPAVPSGRTCHTPVSLIDLAPAITDAVGLPPPAPDLPGRSLFDIATQPDDPTRTVFSEYHAFGLPMTAFMRRNDRYKLNHYVGYEPELFDLWEDPGATTNRATDPAAAAVRREMEARLRAMIDPATVDAQANADQAALIVRHGGPERARDIGAPGATPAPVALANSTNKKGSKPLWTGKNCRSPRTVGGEFWALPSSCMC